jgi:hypothetical protein
VLIRIDKVQKEHSRTSSKGVAHKYVRSHTVAVLRCDCCGVEFERRTRLMDYRRLSEQHNHVCSTCNSKQYAQKKAVESRKFWNTTVDLDKDIGSI